MERKFIFATPEFRQFAEENARKNVTAEVKIVQFFAHVFARDGVVASPFTEIHRFHRFHFQKVKITRILLTLPIIKPKLKTFTSCR